MTLDPRAPHQLLFKRPLFHEGLNITVRLGTKWFTQGHPGDPLHIVDTYDAEQKVLLKTRVLFTCMDNLDRIPESWLQYEHDPTCRTREGLLAVMRRVYGEVDESDVVSIIFFVCDEAWPSSRTESGIMEEALDRPPPAR